MSANATAGELFEHVRFFEYFSQLPSNLVFERGKSDSAVGNELIQAPREIRERASLHLISSPEERPQVEVHRTGEQDELAEGDGVDDLFVEALQIAICLIRDPEQVGELSRIATARSSEPRLGAPPDPRLRDPQAGTSLHPHKGHAAYAS